MRRVAILIDGGFLLKRLPSIWPDFRVQDPNAADEAIGNLVEIHLRTMASEFGVERASSLLYRCFYYDARPYASKAHYPISGKAFDYAKSPEAVFRNSLFVSLRKRPNFAVRLGEVRRERSWILKSKAQKDLLKRLWTVDQLTDDDFTPGFRQKAVDMRLGLDIASLTLKKQADVIILVTGDSDFVPAAKLARREGVRIVVDPLWQSVSADLFEHIDVLRNAFGHHKMGDLNEL